MNFISTRQLVADVKTFSAQLPGDLAAVAGIPRSGVLPAVLLALHRNVHLATLEEIKKGKRPWRESLRREVAGKTDGPVLIVDDSLASGATMRQVRSELRGMGTFLFAALYYQRPHAGLLDFAFREIPPPRCFEWNVFHCRQMQYACLDLDGVICEDWTGREEDGGEGLTRYLKHIERARPRYLPRSYPVLAIVTSRLEKYRRQTETWLERHGVRYGTLSMSPHPTAAARRAAGDNARRKAAFYASCPQARMFVESDPDQAKEITRITGRPVLCTETMELRTGSAAR